MRKITVAAFLAAAVLLVTSCETTRVTRVLSELLQSGQGGVSLETMVAGLKEALTVGTRNAVEKTSRAGGFSADNLLRIRTPPELEKVAKTLRAVGLGRMVDDFEAKMNLAAEQASARATPVFLDAVKGMTFADAKQILQGGDTAATDYFRGRTEKRLGGIFRPIAAEQMAKVGAVRVYNNLMRKYNAIPLVTRPRFDIEDYVTGKTLDGLFATLAAEETRIRRDPVARTTELLRRVFGQP